MDRGIWAIWYDLPEEGKEEYISWLHDTYIPTMLRRPGYLWAAHVENIWDEEREEEADHRIVEATVDEAIDDRSEAGLASHLLEVAHRCTMRPPPEER